MSKQEVNPIRKGFHAITPYLMVEKVADLIEFLEKSFDANVILKLHRPDGTVMHTEIKIGNSMIMAGEPNAEFGRMPGSIYLYVKNCDEVYEKAIKAGGQSVMPVTTMTHAGERYGGVKDSCGNIWWIATHIEDLTEEEEQKRINELF